ncbi:MAG TPA: type II secretion system F family protein [Caulobacteraceae bacterium]
MSWFRYRALSPAGSSQAGVIEGGSRAQALDSIRRTGLRPLEITEVASGGDVSHPVGRQALSGRVLAESFEQLAVLLGAGLTLDAALAVVSQSLQRPNDRAVFADVRRRVQEGATLSWALEQDPARFPPVAVAMAAAGEAEGGLDAALAKLAQSLARAEALRQTLVSALIYPALLCVVAVGVVLTMLLWVVPQFEGLFDEAGARLPAATRLLLAASHGVRRHGLELALALVAAVVGLERLSRQPQMRRAIDAAILRLPHLGALWTTLDVSRFARVLAALTAGGVALTNGVSLAGRTLQNRTLAEAAERVSVSLREGRSLSTAMAAEGVFPATVFVFLRIGEETGALGPMLDRLADVLERDGRMGLDRLLTLLTPLITVAMGGIVAFVIASIMTAILGFNDLALAP